ncbi:MAG: hypothetical protein ABSE73_27590 [Planctomycetota bacterium]
MKGTLLAGAALLACLQPAALADEAAVRGWRRDGSGQYPDAQPPLDWGRVAKSVKILSAQARRPLEGAIPAADAAIPDGVIRKWLVLGPLPLPEDRKLEDILPNAEKLSPDEHETAGGLSWRAVALATDCMDFCELLKIAPDQKGFAALAHVYLFSPSGAPVGFNVLAQGQGTLRVWLNGKALYSSGNNVDIDPGVRLSLTLQIGWNLPFRSSCMLLRAGL